jgi:hypothetical protein
MKAAELLDDDADMPILIDIMLRKLAAGAVIHYDSNGLRGPITGLAKDSKFVRKKSQKHSDKSCPYELKVDVALENGKIRHETTWPTVAEWRDSKLNKRPDGTWLLDMPYYGI